MEKYKNYKSTDFASDQSFIDWVLNPDQVKNEYWKNLIIKFPTIQQEIELAKKVVLSFSTEEQTIPKETIDSLLLKIKSASGNKVTRKQNTFFLKRSWYAAAAVILVAMLVGGNFLLVDVIEKRSYLELEENNQEFSMLFSEGPNPFMFEDSEVTIDYSNEIGIAVNQDSIIQSADDNNVDANEMQRVVVPFGKRISLILSDKTKVWINSGSQLVFPKKFDSKNRDIYLIGEAFFDVTHIESQPFMVHTKNSEVKVLGTRFNVKAYNNDHSEQTVLVNGKVSLSGNKLWNEQSILHPGEMGTFNKQDNSINIKTVDTNLYTSWVDGYLYFKNESTFEVMRQISRYYNKEIIVDKSVNWVSFSGKLDLTQSFDVLISRVTKTSSLRYFYKNGKLIIKQ